MNTSTRTLEGRVSQGGLCARIRASGVKARGDVDGPQVLAGKPQALAGMAGHEF